MTKDELDLIEFQSHGQDLKAIRFLRADRAARDAEVGRLREAAQEVIEDLLDLGLGSNNWIVDRLRAALKGEG